MVRSTWAALTDGLSPDDLALITAYRDFCRSLPDAHEEVTSSAVQYRGKRIFTSAYVKSHYLEVGVELLREATHPKLRTSFPTTKRITMHRITVTTVAQLESAFDLIREAHDTVGPGVSPARRRGR